MISIRERHGKDADHRFAEPPWDEHTPQWVKRPQGTSSNVPMFRGTLCDMSASRRLHAFSSTGPRHQPIGTRRPCRGTSDSHGDPRGEGTLQTTATNDRTSLRRPEPTPAVAPILPLRPAPCPPRPPCPSPDWGGGLGLQLADIAEKPKMRTNPGRTHANHRGSPIVKGGRTLNGRSYFGGAGLASTFSTERTTLLDGGTTLTPNAYGPC